MREETRARQRCFASSSGTCPRSWQKRASTEVSRDSSKTRFKSTFAAAFWRTAYVDFAATVAAMSGWSRCPAMVAAYVRAVAANA
jgi:hypothetical protein